jgi:hypothetical protein
MTEEIAQDAVPQEITQDTNSAPDQPNLEAGTSPSQDVISPIKEEDSSPNTFEIPEEYKDKGWTEKIKSPEDLWKQLDSAQSLIGKKSIVPEFKDGQEKLEYLAQFKPSEKSEYTEVMPEEGWQEGAKEFFTDTFDEANLTKEQAEKVLTKYQEYEKSLQGDLYSEEGWNNTLKEVFPENTETAAKEVSGILRANVSDDRKAMFDAMPNNLRGLVLELTSNLAKRYGAKPEHVPSTSNTNDGGIDIQAKRAQITEQLTNLSKRPHTMEEKQNLIKSLKETY